MEAGNRAQLQVERLEAAVEEARRRLASAEQQLYAWRRGAEGERQTGEVLARLEAEGWVILHDLHWPGRPFANIDHIAIGPTGVFVIDSKNWSGTVEVRDGVLRQNGYARTSECEGVASASAAVSAFLEPRHRRLVAAVLCLVGQSTPSSQPQFAKVVGSEDLSSALERGAARLTSTEVATIGGYLRGLLDGSRSPALATTAALAQAGLAPREPPRSRRRRSSRSVHPTAARRPRAVRRSRSSLATRLALLALTAITVFVFLPATLHGIADSVTPTPAVTPTAKHPKQSGKSTTSPKPTHPGSNARH
jgi:hypothetical protein